MSVELVVDDLVRVLTGVHKGRVGRLTAIRSGMYFPYSVRIHKVGLLVYQRAHIELACQKRLNIFQPGHKKPCRSCEFQLSCLSGG